MRETSTSDRDRALRRLRRTTSVALAAAGALVVAFAGLAAKALPGHRTVTTTTARPHVHTVHRVVSPPPLVAAQSAATPAAPASAPVQTQAAPAQTEAPPVVVSGGT